jgi:Fic family protein
MKLPQRPPRLEFASTLSPERFAEIFPQIQQWSKLDRYLHWDEMKRRPAPKGFTHEEWWFALKLGRGAQLHVVGLKDKAGGFFRFGQPDSLTELLHHIDRGLGAAVGLPEAIEQPAARDRYVINTLIQESITSSQLEGAATTREVAKEMLRTGRPPRDTSERMILNNYLTMRRIRDLQTTQLTPELVFELHRRVTEGTLEKADAAGRFRLPNENVRVIDDIEGTEFHVPPMAEELPTRLEAMCAFANGTAPGYFIHPVIRGIILHFWLAYDHPFYDGNGRTARALFYWSMLHHDYRLFEFISISDILLRAPVRYAKAFLYTETDDNDLTYFILHQAEVIREAVQALHKYIEAKKAELRTADECLRGVQDLNHRQQALLAHALREPATRYLIGAHQRSHGVTHQTARDDLFDLVQRGLLVVHKTGRSYTFRAPHDLSEKLGKLSHAQPSPDTDPSLPLKLPF